MQTILASSGYLPKTMRALKRHWRVIDIPDQYEALTWLQRCTELPAALAIGYVQNPHEHDLPWQADSGLQMPAELMLPAIQRIDPELPVVVSTSQNEPASIVSITKLGAFDYVVEPWRPDSHQDFARYTQELVTALQHAIKWRTTLLENRRLRQQLANETATHPVLTRSPRMHRVLERARKVADTPATVLLIGESGTGKELVAQTIHAMSNRAREPFVAINCGALSESLLTSELFGHIKGAFTGADAHKPGLIREAGAGTLFLDEIGTVSAGFQIMLLRVLEQRVARPVGAGTDYPVTCRFIAAANRSLEDLVAQGKFRDDLFYRLNVFPLNLPPLRQRLEDIPVLAQHFLDDAAKAYGRKISGFEPDAMRRLEQSEWPGNVRQLRNTVERGVILCSGARIGVVEIEESVRDRSDTAPAMPLPVSYATAMRQYERRLLEQTLIACGGNVSQAARRLRMKRTTLAYRLRQVMPQPHD